MGLYFCLTFCWQEWGSTLSFTEFVSPHWRGWETRTIILTIQWKRKLIWRKPLLHNKKGIEVKLPFLPSRKENPRRMFGTGSAVALTWLCFKTVCAISAGGKLVLEEREHCLWNSIWASDSYVIFRLWCYKITTFSHTSTSWSESDIWISFEHLFFPPFYFLNLLQGTYTFQRESQRESAAAPPGDGHAAVPSLPVSPQGFSSHWDPAAPTTIAWAEPSSESL